LTVVSQCARHNINTHVLANMWLGMMIFALLDIFKYVVFH
jgi:hypothetical protein